MKKILFLLFALCFLANPAFCEVKQIVEPYTSQDAFWTDHYDVYQVTFQNEGKNPVIIVNIDISNAIIVNKDLIMSTLTREHQKDLYAGAIPIFGAIIIAKKSKELQNLLENLLVESQTFDYKTNLDNSKNAILLPTASKKFCFVINKGVKPEITGAFQDTTTKEYILAK